MIANCICFTLINPFPSNTKHPLETMVDLQGFTLIWDHLWGVSHLIQYKPKETKKYSNKMSPTAYNDGFEYLPWWFHHVPHVNGWV